MASAKKKGAGANTPAGREPVTASGVELLKTIADNGGMYLTEAEGAAVVASGDAKVDGANTQGDTAFVTLTDQGNAKVAAAAPSAPASVSTGKVQFEVDDDVEMPESTRSNLRGSKYPFDKLEVGQSFHVPKSEDVPDPVSALASSLTGARRRFSQPVTDGNGRPVLETVETNNYKLDAKGKRIKDESGHWIVEGKTKVQRPKMQETRDFKVIAVGPEDKRGPGARVFRTK